MPFDRNELKDMQALYKLVNENASHPVAGLADLSEDELYETLDLMHTRVKHDAKAASDRVQYSDISADSDPWVAPAEDVDGYLRSLEPSPSHPHIKLSYGLHELESLNLAHHTSRTALEKYREAIIDDAYQVLFWRHCANGPMY